MLGKAWLIFRRELGSFVVSPLAAVAGAAFLLITGYVFSLTLVERGRIDLYPLLFRYESNLLLVLCPLLTMRLLAEERQSGSAVLLLTSPVPEWSIVLGKFAAAVAVLAGYLALTLPYAALLLALGSPDPGPIASGYLGALLLCAALCAMGLFASSLTTSPIVAAVVGFGLGTFFGVVERLKDFTGDAMGSLFTGLAYIEPCRDLFDGVLAARHLIYFASVTFFFLYATERMLRSNRWR